MDNIITFVRCGNCGETEFIEAHVLSVYPKEISRDPYLIRFKCQSCGATIYASMRAGRIIFDDMTGSKEK